MAPKRLLPLKTIAALSVVVTGAAMSAPLAVVVSIPPQQWLVEQIGGDQVVVEVLLEPGESPTTYLPSDAQVTRLMRSDVYFRIGVPFERGLWFDAISKLGRFQMADLREGIALRGEDPHIWLSVKLLRVQARLVARTLTQMDPGNSDIYEANLDRLESRLEDLDDEIRSGLRPFSGRVFVVFHPSWGYFAADYGLVQSAIEIEGQEPSDHELTILLAEARESNVTTIFVAPQIHGRGARAVAEVLGARIEILDPLAVEVAENLAETARKLIRSFAEGVVDE